MKVNVLYDKYNTKIEKATLLFGDTPETEQVINLEVIQKDIGDIENEIISNEIRITSADASGIEIENEMNKDELRTFMSLIRELLIQI